MDGDGFNAVHWAILGVEEKVGFYGLIVSKWLNNSYYRLPGVFGGRKATIRDRGES